MYSLEGPCKIAIEALQKQIDLHFKEINKLRSTQNFHIPVSRLPAELLSEVFLYIVETGLQDGDLGFAWGTFGFRRVCRRWNEVAVGFPQLWVWWASGAFSAWHLFNVRSKGVPLSLTWRRWYDLDFDDRDIDGDDTLADPTIPGRIRTLDCTGTTDDLEHLLGAFDSSHSSNASSIRLHIAPYDEHGPRKHTATFLSLSSPKLSRLDLKNSLPAFSSPIFTTSNLVSLKLGIPESDTSRYTRSQFSKILQCHQNLQELHLWQGGMPLVEPPEPSVPIVLPRLIDLQLYGTEAIIAGFVDLVSMSSPLHNFLIDFGSVSTPALAGAVQKILVLYYECQGLDYPHTAGHLTVSLDSGKKSLVFNAGSPSASASHPTSNLELRFGGVDNALAGEICLLFPLDHVLEFTAIGLRLARDTFREMVEKMGGLLHLRLDKVDLGPVMGALGVGDPREGVHKEAVDTILNCLHACRRGARTAYPQPAIVDAQ